MSLNAQAPSAVVMIRPHRFQPNQQTAADNSFQNNDSFDSSALATLAYKQVSLAIETLRAEGVTIHSFEDEGIETPDSVFPNNWFSTHSDGQIAIYPMYAENRRKERRLDIIDYLSKNYRVQEIIDYSPLENEQVFLEGTGAMVLDHQTRTALAVRSKRLDTTAFNRFCKHFNYQPVVFDATDNKGMPVYHTNVLMCIGSEFVMIGLEMINDKSQQNQVIQYFEKNTKTVIQLSEAQINQFCGNALELQGASGRILALSSTAYNALTDIQVKQLQSFVKLVPLEVSAIEKAGGSVRCMLAGIHLEKR